MQPDCAVSNELAGMNRAAALFFDLNGTLLDLSRLRDAVARTCADIAARQPGLAAAQLLESNSQVWRAYWPEVERRWTLGQLEDGTVGLEAWKRVLRACGCYDDSVAQMARQTHRRHTREMTRAFDDVQDFFAWLSDTSLPLAIITNGASGSQRDGLGILGKEHRISTVVISGEVHVAKPDPAIFAIAIQKLGVKPEEVWHVGDSLANDVAGARSAGLTGIWLNRAGLVRTEQQPTPDCEIRSLRQLVDLLQDAS
jgi:putative hydrolase of the HAD superfamily